MATNFGETIKRLRIQKNITQAQLAHALSVGRPTIAGYETKGKQPDYDKLLKLAQFFNVSVDYLLNSSDEGYFPMLPLDNSSAFESKIPYKENLNNINGIGDLNDILTSLINKLDENPTSLVYKDKPLNKTTIIAINNTISNLLDMIEEINRL